MADTGERDAPLSSPQRAHTIILTAGGDTAERLADELRFLADRLDRNQLTVGTIGGPSSHAIYSYKIDPAMTHDAYFKALDEYLAALPTVGLRIGRVEE